MRANSIFESIHLVFLTLHHEADKKKATENEQRTVLRGGFMRPLSSARTSGFRREKG